MATTDDIFAAFEQPAAPKSSNTGTPLTPPSASSSSASLPPPKTTFTAEHNQQFEFAEDEDVLFTRIYLSTHSLGLLRRRTFTRPSPRPSRQATRLVPSRAQSRSSLNDSSKPTTTPLMTTARVRRLADPRARRPTMRRHLIRATCWARWAQCLASSRRLRPRQQRAR